jgi:transcriptional regulator with XRE-family HTH domain
MRFSKRGSIMDNKAENQYIGVNIRRFRLRRRMSEETLAETVSRSHRAMTTASLAALEFGEYRPSPYRIYHIAKALGVSMDALLK